MKLEALVGHLFIVGGQTIETKPPGTLVELPPRRAHRSREEDTLFVLITAAGRKQMPTDLFNELATLGTDAYFRSRVGVTGALRDAVAAVNKRLYGSDFRAGAVFLCKRRDEVYVARCGTTLIAHRSSTDYSTFPGDPDLLNILPLGSRSEPTVEFSRFHLEPGDVFVFGDAGFAQVSDKVLEACISKGEVNQVLDQLEAVVTKEATATIIQFVLPIDETKADSNKHIETPVMSSSLPVDQPVMPSPSGAMTRSGTQKIESDVMVDDRPSILTNAQVAPDELIDAMEKEATVETVTEQEAVPDIKPDTEPSLDEAVETPAPPKRQKQTVPVREKQRKPGAVGRSFGKLAGMLSVGLNRLLPEPDENASPREKIPLNVGIMVAIFIPVVIAIVVVGFTISDQGNTIFEQQRQDAIAAFEDAQTYASTGAADRKTARDLYTIAKGHAADALRFNADDSTLLDIFRQSQQRIDFYDKVSRVQVTSLRDFGDNADLRGPILANAVDLYVMDRNRGKVYRSTLNSNGTALLDSEAEPVIQRGQPIREHIVANLIDIEWMDQGGAALKNALAALDENGLLISYSPVYPPADGLQLVLPPDWRRPVAIATWRQNFYVLDAGANEIWRFSPLNGFYTELPSEYFEGNVRPDLGSAIDFSIDDSGYVYILFADGHIEKYRGGERENFTLYEAPVDGIGRSRALFVDNDPTAYALYVSARENEAIYQISFGGRVNTGYRPVNAPLDAFDALSGVYVDSTRGFPIMYALSGQSLFLVEP